MLLVRYQNQMCMFLMFSWYVMVTHYSLWKWIMRPTTALQASLMWQKWALFFNIQNLQTCMLCFFSWVTIQRVYSLQSWLWVYYSYIHYKINSDYDKDYHIAGYVCEVLICVNSVRCCWLADLTSTVMLIPSF